QLLAIGCLATGLRPVAVSGRLLSWAGRRVCANEVKSNEKCMKTCHDSSASIPGISQDGNLAGIAHCYRQFGMAGAGEIAGDRRDGPATDWVEISRVKSAVAFAPKHADIIAIIVHDHQVELAIAIAIHGKHLSWRFAGSIVAPWTKGSVAAA